MTVKKTALVTAISVAMGIPVGEASDIAVHQITLDWTGAFTLLEPGGGPLFNSASGAQVAPYWGYRTAVSGTLFYDLLADSFTGTITPFSYFGAGNGVATSISFQAIGNGFGGDGSLVLGNMGFNWGGNNGIPISIVWDAAGLFGYLDGLDPNATPTDGGTSDTLSGFGATAATEGQTWTSGGGATFSLPMGPSPMVTTTWNTTDIGTVVLGDNPSGTLPLVDDGIGGSPNSTAPTTDHYYNFDFTTMHVTEYIDFRAPIPAAVWLFGSGLAGLLVMARRRGGKVQV